MLTNTPEVRTDNCSTEMLACISAFDRAIDRIVEWHKPDYNISAADIKDFRNNILSLLRNGGSPDEYFHPIAHGAFKETYEGLGNWVIKFASHFNSTGAERQLLDAANDAGIGFMFATSIYIDLPVKLRSIYLEDATDDTCSLDEDGDCDGDCCSCQWYKQPDDETANILCTAILQPKGWASVDEPYTSFDYSELSYSNCPVYYVGGTIVPYGTMYNLGVTDQSWAQEIINCYGDENFHRLCRFVSDFALSDLHAGNTGYITTSLGDMPVILDWLSRWSD